MPLAAIYSGYSDVGEYTCTYTGERIHYNGNTTLQLVNCLREAPPESRTLSISSSGGEVNVAIFAAHVVNEMALEVEVVGWCASSCANYILPAAKRIYLDQHSLVYVHGAPPAPDRESLIAALARSGFTEESPGFNQSLDDNLERSELTYRLHNSFKKKFGVGGLYYDLEDIASARASEDRSRDLYFVDPEWLRRCLPGVEIVAEAPNREGLQKLLPAYNLVSFSDIRSPEGSCFS